MQITLDKSQLKGIQKILSPKKYQRAITNAINTTATQVRKISFKEASEEYKIKQWNDTYLNAKQQSAYLQIYI